jgi:arylsulfatase A-like enzyme
VASEAVDFIRSRARKDDRFFAIAGFYAPHAPLNPPSRFVDMYDTADLPLPMMSTRENRLGLSDDEWRKVKAYYYALISHVDDQIGNILAALDETGVREHTIVIFTSDHGEHLGDRGQIQKGPPGFDSCAHVPLIVSYPGTIPAGQRKRELIEAVDVAPTILDYCGVQTPPQFQGRSFRPLLQGGDYGERTSVFIEHRVPFQTSWKTVRTHEHKYCVSNLGEELLFDLRSDPAELENVVRAPEHQDVLQAMREELIRRWFDVEKQYPLRTGMY